MSLISLSYLDLALAALLVGVQALLCWRMRLGMTQELLVAAVRTLVQLTLVGLVLKAVFEHVYPGWLMLMALVMVGLAGREVMVRQKRRFRGRWGFGLGTLSMFVSSFAVTLLALTVVIGADPWYTPQYAIPLLGMLLGNTMTGIAISLDRLTQETWQQREMIEARLMLGEGWCRAIGDIRRDSLRSGMIPMINAMAAAGIISLPGMMTGQILAGIAPVEAVKYQILIMFIITAGTGFGTMGAVWFGARRLFDDRERLRLDRLTDG